MTIDTPETALTGRIHRPGDDGYDEARQVWQRRFDPHPTLIVDAASADDVRAAVRHARASGLPLAVQSTGHGVAVPADGALLLRTAAMDGVSVDPGRGVARVEAGALWSAVIAAAAPHGLAPLSGSAASVGVVGYTLGGGFGWLSRAFGYAADSVLLAEVVTADSDLVTATADEHPDLFWALRGGGGNFGVVTALEFRLHPVATVYGGTAMFAPERAPELLRRYARWAQTEPDASNSAVVVMQVPPLPFMPEAVRGRRVAAVRGLFAGGADAARATWAPLLEAGGEPLLDTMQEMPYADVATAFGPPPPPSVGELQAEFVRDVPDDAIEALTSFQAPVMMTELRHWGGATARPGPGAGPLGHRDVPFSVTVGGMVERREQWAGLRDAVDDVMDRLSPHTTGTTFLNFLADPARVASAYTDEDFARLRSIKAAYDPDNVFGRNLNVPPGA